MRRIVIVGAGLAGLRAGQQLRSRGFDGEIVIVGDEPHQPYTRPPLSKQVLLGETEPTECTLSQDGVDVWWIRGCAATGLDTRRRTVRLETVEDLPYDGLIIATGRRARQWPHRPALSGIHTLRGLDDAIAFRDALRSNPRVTIVGAGFIGCEVAASIRARGVDEVSLIDTADRPLPSLGPEIGHRVAERHIDHGVHLHCGTYISGFHGTRRVESVTLADGKCIDTDVVLVAVGSSPNTEWLSSSAVPLRNGNVLCDTNCMVPGLNDTVAAGDVAAWTHPLADDPILLEHWTNAVEMAQQAANNLLLGPDAATPYTPIPTFWSNQYDMKLKSVGLPIMAETTKVVEDSAVTGKFALEGYRHGRLVAATTINNNRSFVRYHRSLAATGASTHNQLDQVHEDRTR